MNDKLNYRLNDVNFKAEATQNIMTHNEIEEFSRYFKLYQHNIKDSRSFKIPITHYVKFGLFNEFLDSFEATDLGVALYDRLTKPNHG